MQKLLLGIEKHLKNLKKFAINYLQGLLDKYGKHYPRKTQFQAIQQINMRAIETRTIKVGFDPDTGFVGTKVGGDNLFECTNFDKLLLCFKDGTYTVINVPEKQYVHHEGNKVVYVGVADKKTVMRAIYKDPKRHLFYAKRFIIDKFMLEKTYRYYEEGMELVFLTTQPDISVEMLYMPSLKQRVTKAPFDLDSVLIKGVGAKGNRMSSKEIKKVTVLKKTSAAPATPAAPAAAAAAAAKEAK